MRKYFLLVFIIFLFGCEGSITESRNTPWFEYVDNGEACYYMNEDVPQLVEDTPEPEWEPTCFYPVQDWRTGTYVNGLNQPFTMNMESDNLDDYNNLSPYEVGELASWAVTVHALMGLPNNDKVKDILREGHWVVTNNDVVFARLFNSPGDDALKYQAFIWIDKRRACWESPESSQWTSIIRSRYWNRENPIIAIHEMMHAVAWATYGDADPDHSEPTIWSYLGENTVQQYVFNIHACTYYPDSPACPAN